MGRRQLCRSQARRKDLLKHPRSYEKTIRKRRNSASAIRNRSEQNPVSAAIGRRLLHHYGGSARVFNRAMDSRYQFEEDLPWKPSRRLRNSNRICMDIRGKSPERGRCDQRSQTCRSRSTVNPRQGMLHPDLEGRARVKAETANSIQKAPAIQGLAGSSRRSANRRTQQAGGLATSGSNRRNRRGETWPSF